jgi:uncharacterized membrane-anchored protein YhcB (DUF1043 family)
MMDDAVTISAISTTGIIVVAVISFYGNKLAANQKSLKENLKTVSENVDGTMSNMRAELKTATELIVALTADRGRFTGILEEKDYVRDQAIKAAEQDNEIRSRADRAEGKLEQQGDDRHRAMNKPEAENHL